MEIGSNEKGNNCVMIIVGRVLIKFDNENDGDADDVDDDDDVDGCVRVGWQAGGSSSFHASPQNPVLL